MSWNAKRKRRCGHDDGSNRTARALGFSDAPAGMAAAAVAEAAAAVAAAGAAEAAVA